MGEIKEYFYTPGDVISCTRTTWTVLGRKIVLGGNKKQSYSHKEYLCQCHKCKSSLWKTENELKQGSRGKQGQGNCGVCYNCVVVTGKNDVATTHPDLVRLFKDPEDALHINAMSREKRFFKCPNCGYEFETCVEYVTSRKRLCCPKCSDGISYPNKFARSVLTQVGAENLEVEYHPKWSNNYRYDFSFYKDHHHYLVEMDGGFHFMERFGRKQKQIKNRDDIKTELAQKNGCTLIRIECSKSDSEYIKQKFFESEISNLFDLNKVDWRQVELDCCKSAVVDVNKYYLEHPTMSAKEIANSLALSPMTVRTYLKRGAKMGINKYETLLDTMNKNYSKVVDFKKSHLEWSNKQIADATGVEQATVRNYLIKAKEQGYIEEIDAQKIRKDRIREYVKNNLDKSNAALARDMNCCVGYIRERRKELLTA